VSHRDYIVVIETSELTGTEDLVDPQAVVILAGTHTLLDNNVPSEVIQVIEAGPQGPPGPTGFATYENALTGSRYTILYNNVAWPASRPSARTDIYFDLIGGDNTVADPGWMINGDAREVVVS
jgi:hypothetical protein